MHISTLAVIALCGMVCLVQLNTISLILKVHNQPSAEKTGETSWSSQRETMILWYVKTLSRFLIILRHVHRCLLNSTQLDSSSSVKKIMIYNLKLVYMLK